MIYIYSFLIIALSALLWRVRGGMGERQGIEIPCNKIYFAIFIGVVNSCIHYWTIKDGVIGVIAAYTSYQLYGWGKYVGALVAGHLNKLEKECELIDEILDACRITFGKKSAKLWNFLFGWIVKVEPKTYYLWDYPRVYGFLGTSLSMFIVTFIIGLAFGSLSFMLSGLMGGFCYYLGHLVCKYIKDDGKNGWNWGEWIFGAYLGARIAYVLYS